MQVGDQIRQYRKKQGLTQNALAELLHVTPQTVSQWERDVTIPDTSKLADIVVALHTTVNMLTGEQKGDDRSLSFHERGAFEIGGGAFVC